MMSGASLDLNHRERRLVGRERETATMQRALEDPQVRAIVARGEPGAGKTALVRSVVQDAQAAGAITGHGKYPEGGAGRDLDPVIAAIEGAIACGLELLFDPDAGLRDLVRALGDNTRVFSNVRPGLLRTLAGPATSAPLTADRADEQLAQALGDVVTWLEGFGAPVLIHLDDWGRAGPQAQRAIARLQGGGRTKILATERNDEQFGAALPGSMIVAVGPLPPAARMELARTALGETAGAAADVLALLGEAAERPFDLIESIRVLIAGEAIVRRGGAWRLDMARAAPALAGAAAGSAVRTALEGDRAVDAIAKRLAVHGDGAEAGDIAEAANETAQAVDRALARLTSTGLVEWAGDLLAFSHDRFRAEVLHRIDPAERRRLAGELADALRRNGAQPGDGERGMTLLWLGLEAGLETLEKTWWREAFATGALRAREIGDRVAAERFVSAGLQLAAAGAGFSYRLLGEAAFAALTRGDDGAAQRFADRMEGYAGTAIERAVAQELRVFARRASGDLDAALEVAREVVASNGVKLPKRAAIWNLISAVVRVFSLDPAKAVRPLSPATLAVEAPMMRAINGIGSLLFERSPLLAVVFVTRSLTTSVVYGTAAGAGTWTLMCCAFGAYRRAAAWAEASDRLQGPDQPLRAVAKQYSTNFGHVFARPRPVTRARGDEMTALAYAGGDLAVSAYGNRDKVLDAIFSDDPLDDTTRLADSAIQVAERLGDAATIPHVRALRQLIDQLRVGGPSGWRLDGAHLDILACRTKLRDDGLANTGRGIAALEVLLATLHGRYAEAAALAARDWPKFGGAPFQAQTQIWAFSAGLARYRTGGRASALARWNLRRLAQLNPNDFRHRSRLLDAEQAKARGRRRRALAFYADAIHAASTSRCLLEYGLVAAAAAEGAESFGQADLARNWRDEAIQAWSQLGADALIRERFGIRPQTASSGISEHPPSDEDAAACLKVDGEAALRASRAKSRLLAAVGHELRTPLQGALGLLELAETEGRDVDLPTLRRALSHLSGVVGDLTDAGALDGGVLSLRAAPFEAIALTQSVVALHRPAAQALGREIACEHPVEPIWASGDEGRLRQVLGNLIANALKYGEGVVQIAIERFEPGRLRVRVTDAGAPLAPEDAIRIFEPFSRGERATEDAGLGVGLYLGRRLARAMGGDLVLTRAAAGNTFELEIAAPEAEAHAASDASSLRGLHVLLAEDTQLSREVLARLLRNAGCEVTEVSDGEAALALAGKAPFDLLVLDHRMPGATGLDVACAWRGQPGTPPRIVLMSASVETDLAERALSAGVDVLLQKPVSLADLRAAAGTSEGKSDRIAELRHHLGADAEVLLAALRPALEAEIEQLEKTIGAGDPARIEAQRHRLKGLAAHFGVAPLSAILDQPISDADLALRLRVAVATVDWPALTAVS